MRRMEIWPRAATTARTRTLCPQSSLPKRWEQNLAGWLGLYYYSVRFIYHRSGKYIHTRQDRMAILGGILPIFRQWYPIYCFSAHLFTDSSYFHLFQWFSAYFPPKMVPHPCYILKHGTPWFPSSCLWILPIFHLCSTHFPPVLSCMVGREDISYLVGMLHLIWSSNHLYEMKHQELVMVIYFVANLLSYLFIWKQIWWAQFYINSHRPMKFVKLFSYT